MKIEARLKAFQNNLDSQTAVLFSKPTDISYLVDFGFLVPEEREAFLLITKTQVTLFHHSFSPIKKTSFCQYVAGISLEQLTKSLDQKLKDQSDTRLLIDKNDLVVTEWEALQTLPVKLDKLTHDWLNQQKMSKDEEEIEKMVTAGKISAQTFEKLKRKIKIGLTEIEVAELLKEILRKLGSQQEAFPTIVAFGENTALLHHQPTNKKLENNQAILIDFGATVSNYRSDMTRSWWFGPNPDLEYLQISKTINAAYLAGVKALQSPEVTAAKIDQATRSIINQAGYGQYFIHTTGHGLGLDIHESPSIYLTNKTLIPNNCVITIEPGIYLPGKFGIRYENTLLLKDAQVFCLTESKLKMI
ncbi:M24 family metallopeptidase [Patescibacteria group bacterium]|nr:M24 family metallopeptidase [Patescibacteria group bacterium]